MRCVFHSTFLLRSFRIVQEHISIWFPFQSSYTHFTMLQDMLISKLDCSFFNADFQLMAISAIFLLGFHRIVYYVSFGYFSIPSNIYFKICIVSNQTKPSKSEFYAFPARVQGGLKSSNWEWLHRIAETRSIYQRFFSSSLSLQNSFGSFYPHILPNNW